MRSGLSKTPRVAGRRLLPTPRELIHWVRSAHLTQAAEIVALSRRAGLDEVRVWAAASAMNLSPAGLARMLQSLATIREMNASGGSTSVRDLQPLVKQLRELAIEHAQPPRRIDSGGAPQGTGLFPAALYRNTKPLNVEGASAREFVANIEGQPTRTDPERWFKFWSEQCTLLGKMPTLGDLQGAIKANLARFPRTFLVSKPPPPIVTRTEAPESIHDFHVAFFGTRTDSWWGQEGLMLDTLGYSGEDSLWARLMRTAPPYAFYTSKESLISAFEEKVDVRNPEWDGETRNWHDMTGPTLESGGRLAVIQQFKVFYGLGRLTPPVVRERAKHLLNTLLSSAPGTAERIDAAKEVRTLLEHGPGRASSDACSLRAVWTEMVLVQVLSVYFEESGLANQYRAGQVDANQVFDMGRAHQIFEEMQQRGTLISLPDVRAMLGRIRQSRVVPSKSVIMRPEDPRLRY
jgi:hypothetical protein